MGKPRIAINGMGRIGRLLLRILMERDEVDVVAFNDLASHDMLAHLLKYDTAQGTFGLHVKPDDDNIEIGGKTVRGFMEREPEKLPWKELGVDAVAECTGIFRKRDEALRHVTAGAKRVVISAPSSEDVTTIVLGLNDHKITPEENLYSNASCTTNCLAPMAKVMHENFGIRDALMSTIHAYTADQNLQDGIHKKDFRRARAAALNMVPTSTGATKALGWVMPEMKGKLQGSAIRVPVVTGSVVELYCNLEREAGTEEINKAFQKASETDLRGILEYTEEPLVSSDIVGRPASCVFDSQLTLGGSRHVKVVGWYDNEFGYAARMADMMTMVAKL